MSSTTGRHRAQKSSHATRLAAVTVAALSVSLIGAGTAEAASDSTWDRLAQCESSGDWAINTGNGFSGGLQFTPSTWRAYGGTGLPQNASRAQQIAVAERVLQGQGWGAWPACSKKLGISEGVTLRGATPPKAPVVKAAPKVTPKPKAQKPKATAAPRAKHAASGDYTVIAGDTLSKIAARQNVPGGWRALFAKNAGTVANPNKIFPGQKLDV